MDFKLILENAWYLLLIVFCLYLIYAIFRIVTDDIAKRRVQRKMIKELKKIEQIVTKGKKTNE